MPRRSNARTSQQRLEVAGRLPLQILNLPELAGLLKPCSRPVGQEAKLTAGKRFQKGDGFPGIDRPARLDPHVHLRYRGEFVCGYKSAGHVKGVLAEGADHAVHLPQEWRQVRAQPPSSREANSRLPAPVKAVVRSIRGIIDGTELQLEAAVGALLQESLQPLRL